MKQHICVGVVAHVDSGKTTLSENILFKAGSIRNMGRVDHGNSFFDNFSLERERGITIFSKQAKLRLGDKIYTLLDTPGHIDFQAEMERALQVLDYAILVISGADGIQGHTLTLWKLLQRYEVPCFIFVNKMDQPGTDRDKLIHELQARLSENCIDMGKVYKASLDFENIDAKETDKKGECLQKADLEEIAVLDEMVMDYYLENHDITEQQISDMIAERKLTPCYFGSALKDEGVREFLDAFEKYTHAREYTTDFGARVFKITRDDKGNRLTHLKITGGVLKVKSYISNANLSANSNTDSNSNIELVSENRNDWEEKIDQIRIYSGDKFETVNEVQAGEICAVTGLTRTKAGEGLGADMGSISPYLEPVLTYQIILPEGSDVHGMLLKLKQLEEENPHLHIVWNEQLGEIHAQVMGEIEIEILKKLIYERFDVDVEFGSGSIVYKETIDDMVEGVGHYEPLKHYAEVHLKLEPAERGSGVSFNVECDEDSLARNWQRLILTHLEEKKHKGVLTGAEITDVKITLIAGKAHLKHTEGGDFRQATYRAVRHGLKRAKSILLEPVYEFRLEIPGNCVGRALTDIQRMNGKSNLPDMEGDMTVITGTAPIATMSDYHMEVTAYTGGKGKLFLALKGYEPCHNSSEVIERIGYDSEKDLDNPTGSVFCAHGAGFVVDWMDVCDYMHIYTYMSEDDKKLSADESVGQKEKVIGANAYNPSELDEIFERTYGPIDRNKNIHYNRDYERLEAEREKLRRIEGKAFDAAVKKYQDRHSRQGQKKDKYLLVDGYNIIFAWDDLKVLSESSLDAARTKLMDIMCDYQGYKGEIVIIVFDAYKVQGNRGDVQKYNNIHVIYTKEAETADQYIEKAVHKIAKSHDVTVATSDALEQIIIWGEGAKRLSARDLQSQLEAIRSHMRDNYLADNHKKFGYNPFSKI